MRAKFDPGLDPRVVAAQYGWWQAKDELGLPGYDPLSAQRRTLVAVGSGARDEQINAEQMPGH
jgi:hypothetical protein